MFRSSECMYVPTGSALPELTAISHGARVGTFLRNINISTRWHLSHIQYSTLIKVRDRAGPTTWRKWHDCSPLFFHGIRLSDCTVNKRKWVIHTLLPQDIHLKTVEYSENWLICSKMYSMLRQACDGSDNVDNRIGSLEAVFNVSRVLARLEISKLLSKRGQVSTCGGKWLSRKKKLTVRNAAGLCSSAQNNKGVSRMME